jgi:hypothetical protein
MDRLAREPYERREHAGCYTGATHIRRTEGGRLGALSGAQARGRRRGRPIELKSNGCREHQRPVRRLDSRDTMRRLTSAEPCLRQIRVRPPVITLLRSDKSDDKHSVPATGVIH